MSLIHVRSLECPACNAPYSPGQAFCGFCGSALPQATPPPEPTLTPVDREVEDQEIIDYYALLGLTPMHLLPVEPPRRRLSLRRHDDDEPPPLPKPRPIDPTEVHQASLRAQERLLLSPTLDPTWRQKQINQIEIAAWVLSHERSRYTYDEILLSLRKGTFGPGHVASLAELRRQAQEAMGLDTDILDGNELLHQGIGYQTLGMRREALETLRRAAEALPDSAEAHYRYGQTLLAIEDPLSAGGHTLRQIVAAFGRAAALDPRLSDAPAYVALGQGLLARQDGNPNQAQAELRRAVQLLPSLGYAWRALAAIEMQAARYESVLSLCRQALLADPKDERTYELLVAACWRMGRHEFAQDAAARLAALRGTGWDAARILRDLIG